MQPDPSTPTNKIPEVPKGEAPGWAASDAKKEKAQWGSLDQIKQENDGRWLRVYGQILIVLTVTFTAIFLSALVVWTWHQIGPVEICGWRLHWLDDAKLSRIQSILFSGGMGAIISGIVRTQMQKGL